MSLLGSAKYAFEAFANRDLARASLAIPANSTQAEQFLLHKPGIAISVSEVFGRILHDMAFDPKNFEAREASARASARFLILTDIIDEVLDERPTSLSEKLQFLKRAKESLLTGKSDLGEDPMQNATFDIASYIYRGYVLRDVSGEFSRVINKLTTAAERQFTERDFNELVKITRDIGGCCLEGAAVLTQIANGQIVPWLSKVAFHVGAYGLFLDHAYEIDDDLKSGSNTMATAMIAKLGDGAKTRKEILERYRMHAQEERQLALEAAPTGSREYVNSIIDLINARYSLSPLAALTYRIERKLNGEGS